MGARSQPSAGGSLTIEVVQVGHDRMEALGSGCRRSLLHRGVRRRPRPREHPPRRSPLSGRVSGRDVGPFRDAAAVGRCPNPDFRGYRSDPLSAWDGGRGHLGIHRRPPARRHRHPLCRDRARAHVPRSPGTATRTAEASATGTTGVSLPSAKREPSGGLRAVSSGGGFLAAVLTRLPSCSTVYIASTSDAPSHSSVQSTPSTAAHVRALLSILRKRKRTGCRVLPRLWQAPSSTAVKDE